MTAGKHASQGSRTVPGWLLAVVLLVVAGIVGFVLLGASEESKTSDEVACRTANLTNGTEYPC